MFSHKHLLAIIGIIAAHDLYTNLQLSKVCQRFSQSIDDHALERDATQHQIEYLCHLLAENGIEPSEFDKIALTNPFI